MALIALFGVAWADPVALRVLGDGAVAAGVGTVGASVGVELPSRLQLAVDLGWDGATVGLSAGRRARILTAGPWRWDAGVAGGLVVVPYGRTVGGTATPWTSGGIAGRRGALTGIVAVPWLVAPGAGVRVPVSAELVGGVAVGRVWFGPRVATGPVWTPGLDVSLALEAGLVVRWSRWDRCGT